MSPAAALAISAGLALGGRVAGWLTTGGAAAAAFVGGTVLAGSGQEGGSLLAFFFLSSSALTSWNEHRALAAPDTKGARRDAKQVLANGAWAAAGSFLPGSLPCAGGHFSSAPSRRRRQTRGQRRSARTPPAVPA